MKKLTLIRYVKSDWHSPVDSDFDRPLNGRGQKAAPLMGERLAERSSAPDLLISSPAKRARQTAKKIAEQIEYPKTEIQFVEDIYEAGLRTLINLINQIDNQQAEVMMIGHNPGFSDLGQWLSSSSPDWLPTCGLLELELPVESWAEIEEDCATLLLYDYPKKTD
jgi:phosphohistidine phosphatase